MLDFDASKLLIIGVVALVVIGPKDLPRVLRQVGQAVTKLRRMASDFQGQFMDAMKEADLQDLQKEVSKLKDSATLDVHFDPVRDVRNELSGVLEPASAGSTALDPIADASHTVAREAGAIDALPNVGMKSFTLPPPVLTAPAVVIEAPSEPAPEAEAADAAFRTSAESAGGIGAPVPPDPSRRRKIVVAKRRAPGDRLSIARAGPALMARSRPILPPRHDDSRT